MNKLIVYFLTLFFAISLSCCSADINEVSIEEKTISSQYKSDTTKSDSIQQILNQVVEDGKVPGIVAAIISSDSLIAIASAGERKAGSGIKFTINDMVHLGSCTKTMTATMMATLVQEGKLNWETKLIEAIPELKEKIHVDYHTITLWQLLTHRAGLPKNASDWGAYKHTEIAERRLKILTDNLQSQAGYKMGEFHYSNLGYTIAACMAEQITGKSWEDLMTNRLFDPLGMSSVGFGPPNTHNKIDQPWGHSKSWFGWHPDQTDNSEALGPAGTVHCNIEDWAKFIVLQLKEENSILERKYLDKLIEPVSGHFYAGGWGVAEVEWAKGKMLTHSGSNGIWYTSVLVVPECNRAFFVSTNSRDFGVTENLCVEVVNKLIIMELNIKK